MFSKSRLFSGHLGMKFATTLKEGNEETLCFKYHDTILWAFLFFISYVGPLCARIIKLCYNIIFAGNFTTEPPQGDISHTAL